MSRLLLSACLCMAAFTAPVGTSTANAAEVAPVRKLALVDVQRCIAETKQGKRELRELERSMTRSNAKLERRAEQLKRQVSDLQAKAAVLSQDELMRRQAELARSEQELQQLYQESGQKLQQDQAVMTEKMYKNIAKVVKQMALEEQIQVVLVRSQMTVLYANPKLDLTNRVIVAYDKKYK